MLRSSFIALRAQDAFYRRLKKDKHITTFSNITGFKVTSTVSGKYLKAVDWIFGGSLTSLFHFISFENQ